MVTSVGLALCLNIEVGELPTTTKSTDVSQHTPPEDQPLVERSTPVDTSVSMTTSAATGLVCDTQTGATCYLFAETTGGTLTEPAAISYASGEATASMATTADDAPDMPVVELPTYDPPATLTYGQHARPAPPRSFKPISTPHRTFEDAVDLISAAQIDCLFLRRATEMCQRRCHPCTPGARAISSSLFYAPARRPLYSPPEIAVCVAKPYFRHGLPVIIGRHAPARTTRRQRRILTEAHVHADHAPLSTPAHISHQSAPQHPH
ncbi:hypothetical protein MTO96_026799 [Rhipicephalus appendiculatus]